MTGNQLKVEIRKLNMTQAEAAKRLGITRQTLSLWFKYAKIDESVLHLVAANLDINLLDHEEPQIDVNRQLQENYIKIIAVLEKNIAFLERDNERLLSENECLRAALDELKRAL